MATDIQTRLNDLSGRVQYLKAEKARIEKDREALKAELKAAGAETPEELRQIIDARKKDYEDTQAQYVAKLDAYEAKVVEVERKVQG